MSVKENTKIEYKIPTLVITREPEIKSYHATKPYKGSETAQNLLLLHITRASKLRLSLRIKE